MLELKCTPTEVVRWNPSTIILLDETKRLHIDAIKIEALNNGHHFGFQDQRVPLKNNFIIMTSNIGFTTNAKGASNIIGVNFGEK